MREDHVRVHFRRSLVLCVLFRSYVYNADIRTIAESEYIFSDLCIVTCRPPHHNCDEHINHRGERDYNRGKRDRILPSTRFSIQLFSFLTPTADVLSLVQTLPETS